MEFIPKNDILEFRQDQLTSVRKQYNFDKPEDMNRAIDVLEGWIKTQKHFIKKELPRNYIEKAILASKGSLERTKNKLDKICTFRSVMPDFFGDNLTKNKFNELDIFKAAVLPKPTDDHYRTCILKLRGSSFTSNLLLNIYKYTVLVFEYIMAHDYNNGFLILLDFKEVNVMELIKALNLTDTRQITTIVTEGFGMRLKGLHFLSQSKGIDTLVSIVKQLMSQKLGKRIYIHNDITNLYQYISKDILPMEYGGQEKSVKELCEKLMVELTQTDFTKYVEEMGNARTDEACRQTDKFNEQYLGMPGSFRTLSVD